MNALNIETKQTEDGRFHIEMRGKINERFDGNDVVHAAQGRRVVIHLGGVRQVSSVGIREFERFVEQLASVTLVDVSPAIASQLVLLPTLASRVTVETVQLPFACRACGSEKNAPVPFAMGAATSSAPTCTCGHRMELDGMAEQYLPS